jgi:hypothetical protein
MQAKPQAYLKAKDVAHNLASISDVSSVDDVRGLAGLEVFRIRMHVLPTKALLQLKL